MSASPRPVPTRKASSSRLRRWVVRTAAAYLGVALAAWATVDLGDRVPWATVFLFGPRWVIALPLAPVALAAVWARSRAAGWWLLATAVVVAVPVTGGVFRLGGAEREAGATRLRVLTCNTDGSALDVRRFATLLDDTRPDIVLTQESPPTGSPPWLPRSWYVAAAGNRVTVASRFPVRLLAELGPGELGMPGAGARFAVRTESGELTVVNLHLPTPRDGLEVALHRPTELGVLRDVIARRERASEVAAAWAAADEMTVVGGDFNMPVESRIYARDWGGFGNAFSAAGTGWGYTKWTRWFGVRIDHILYSSPWVCTAAWVGPDVGSDHRPLLADLRWAPAD